LPVCHLNLKRSAARLTLNGAPLIDGFRVGDRGTRNQSILNVFNSIAVASETWAYKYGVCILHPRPTFQTHRVCLEILNHFHIRACVMEESASELTFVVSVQRFRLEKNPSGISYGLDGRVTKPTPCYGTMVNKHLPCLRTNIRVHSSQLANEMLGAALQAFPSPPSNVNRGMSRSGFAECDFLFPQQAA